jgi:CDP-glycerol glycerophosphotransferase (TagB/SpsB family)
MTAEVTTKTRLLGFFVVLARGLYSLFTLLPVRDKVTFVSRQQNFTSIDFELLAERIHEVSPSTDVVVLNHPLNPKILYPFKVCVEMFHIATSRAVVVDSYNIVVSVFTHKPHLRIFQIWHALGAFKAFGLTAVDTAEGSSSAVASVMQMHRNYTYVTTASRATGTTFQECFGVSPGQILIAGSPRVDYLQDRERQAEQRVALRRKYAVADDHAVVLFAPTFRKGSALPLAELVDAFDFDRFTLVFRKHPLDTLTEISDPRVVVPDEREGIELLAMADHVVTDYSAIAFEATLLDLPLIFWAFDLDDYSAKRGFAMNFVDEAPGPIVSKATQVVDALVATNNRPAKYAAFRDRYIETRGFNNSERIVREILGDGRANVH